MSDAKPEIERIIASGRIVRSRRVEQLDKQFAEIATRLNVHYLSVFDTLRKDEHWLKEAIVNDFAHPRKYGHDRLATLVQD